MLNSNVIRGKDGRCFEVLSNNDIENGDIWEKVKRSNLLTCEKWLVLTEIDLLDLTGLGISQIRMVKSVACKKISPRIYNANLHETHNGLFSYGSERLDHEFGSLLKPGSLLEIWGEAGSGKTQLALQMCSTLSQSQHSAYISTEGAVPTSRLVDMCSARGISQINCEIQSCISLENFTDCIMKQLPLLIHQKNVKLIVIDSIAAIFRAGETDGTGIYRAQKIRSIGQQLKYLAHHHQLLAVVLNQATENPNTGLMPALGMTWSYLVNSRLMIQKIHMNESISLRRITVQKASSMKLGKYVECNIHKNGII